MSDYLSPASVSSSAAWDGVAAPETSEGHCEVRWVSQEHCRRKELGSPAGNPRLFQDSWQNLRQSVEPRMEKQEASWAPGRGSPLGVFPCPTETS